MGLFKGGAKGGGAGKGGLIKWIVSALFNAKTIWHTLFIIFIILSVAPHIGTAFETGDFNPVLNAGVERVVLADVYLYNSVVEFKNVNYEDLNFLGRAWALIKGIFNILVPIYIIIYFIVLLIKLVRLLDGSPSLSIGLIVLAILILFLLQLNYYNSNDIEEKPFSGVTELTKSLFKGELSEPLDSVLYAFPTKGKVLKSIVADDNSTKIIIDHNVTLMNITTNTTNTSNTSVGAWG